jgi:hypothetical protein
MSEEESKPKLTLEYCLMVLSRVAGPVCIFLAFYVSYRLSDWERSLVEKLDKRFVNVEVLKAQSETQSVRFEALSKQIDDVRKSIDLDRKLEDFKRSMARNADMEPRR